MGNVVRISHKEMDAAFCRGAAIPYSRSALWLVWYFGAWWVVYPSGWLKITPDLTPGDTGPKLAV
jgi:hypothetical protein